MNLILLTQNDGVILGPIAKVLGWIMEGIFTVLDAIGIPNVGLMIILFTIVVNLLLMPLTIKQQKFSKLSAKIQPEIQAIQAKYKGKKDEASMMAQNQEVQEVYAKYGVSPMGSCSYLIIQMPILFALYRVIYAIPAYVTKIGDVFRVLADKIMSVDNGAFLQNSEVASIKSVVDVYGQSLTEGTNVQNGIVDVLNRLSSSDLQSVAQHYDLSQLTYEGELILSNATTTGLLDTYNNFLGLNMADSPLDLAKSAMAAGSWLMVIAAISIPVLSAVTQWINYKLMPQQDTSSANANDQAAAMQASMKTMNKIMPLMSAWFCFSFPAGMGLYWVAGSVVRSIQQVIVNKHIDKMDFDEIIKKNSKKSAKKMAKLKENQERLNAYASMNTKSIKSNASSYNNSASASNSNNQSSSTTTSTAKPGSMMAKANMVRDFNEKNNK